MEKELDRAVKSANLKIELLKINYKKYREAWKDEQDDRLVFCNTYDMILEACEAMRSVTNNFIWVAFNKHYCEEEQLLKSIIEHFDTK